MKEISSLNLKDVIAVLTQTTHIVFQTFVLGRFEINFGYQEEIMFCVGIYLDFITTLGFCNRQLSASVSIFFAAIYKFSMIYITEINEISSEQKALESLQFGKASDASSSNKGL